MSIKDPETERLAAELAARTGGTKTGAVREALRARLAQLRAEADVEERKARMQRFLETEVWPHIPDDIRGKGISQAEQDEILGYGQHGV